MKNERTSKTIAVIELVVAICASILAIGGILLWSALRVYEIVNK